MTQAAPPLPVRRATVHGQELVDAAAPRASALHLFDAGDDGARPHLLVADGSRIFGLDPATYEALARASAAGDDAVDHELSRLGLGGTRFVDDTPPHLPAVRALSLAVAQTCNLGCTYCYARQGSFGGEPASMALDVALASVELLVACAAAGERVNLAFLGGEPLANRAVVRAATTHAAARAMAAGVPITFSITTNGTLLTEDDGRFFEEHGFAVTISLDGIGEAHDRLRPFKGGRGSYARVVEAAAPLLAMQRRMQVSARVTVTPENLELAATLDELVRLGFHSVGFSPMLASPEGADELAASDLETMLARMIECGRAFERAMLERRRYPFANMTNAIRALARGTHRPYPCGAGAGYFGVSADGDLAACHRFVGDPAGAMGTLSAGVDPARRMAWLAERHVHRQEPCRSCWARYLCGGGCHHEVIHRGRPACDYIRGWLHYCLGAFIRLSDAGVVDGA